MIFGFYIPPLAMVAGGAVLFLVLVFQVLLGMRKIKLGRQWTKWHRWTAYALLLIALGHGLAGILFVTGWRLF